MNRKLLIPLALVCLLAGACAKNSASTTGQDVREYLKLWMDKYHPGIAANADGLYILEDTPGTGADWNSELSYVYVDVTIRSLSGTVSATTDKTLSQQLGTYVPGNYYGPKYQMLGDGTSYAGVDALLKGMKLGGFRKAVIPAWMLTTSRYNTQKEYIGACTGSNSLIYEVGLKGQTDDPQQDEADFLADYVSKTYGANVESVSYVSGEEPDGTFWFVSDTTRFQEEEKLRSSATVKINYTGRLAKEGTVFDTSKEKVAKDEGIFSASKTYGPSSITFNSSYESITMDGSSVISGFKGGMSLMHWKGQKAVFLFTSKHGYTSSGSGNRIPGYAPLIFEVEILNE